MSENFQTAMEVMRTQGTDDINLMRQKLNQTDLVLSDITNQTNSIANATNVLYDKMEMVTYISIISNYIRRSTGILYDAV